MTNYEIRAESQRVVETTKPQIPELGIESVVPGDAVRVTRESMPWISSDEIEIPTVMVRAEDGTEFQYGSCINTNGTLEKLARQVPTQESRKAETGLFKALPLWLKGQNVPNIDVAVGSLGSKIYKVSKPGKDPARLAFVRIGGEERPTIIKVGISRHKDQVKMLGMMTNFGSGQKKDG